MVSQTSRHFPLTHLHDAARTFERWLPIMVVALAIGPWSSACATETQPEPAAREGVTNADLNLAFASLPEGMAVSKNDALAIVLRAEEETAGAREMWVEVDQTSDFGIQLNEIVAGQKAAFELMPDGSFGGNRQISTPAGQGYYSRGAYSYEGTLVEETRVFLVHPTENRLVTFHYRYPAQSDSAARIQELFGWVAEMSAPG